MASLLDTQLQCKKCHEPLALLTIGIKGAYKATKKVVDTRYLRMRAHCPKHGTVSLTIPFHAWNDVVATATRHILACDKCGQPTTPQHFKMSPQISTIHVHCPIHGTRKRQIATPLAGDIWTHASQSTPPPSTQPHLPPTANHCPQCGTPIKPTDNFCPQCGTSLQPSKD